MSNIDRAMIFSRLFKKKNKAVSVLDRIRKGLTDPSRINEPDNQGHFILYMIINSDEPSLLREAISKGINVNQDLGNGWTALHEAIDLAIDGMIQNNKEAPYPESIEMTKILLENGAKLNVKDVEGKTPLDALNTYSGNIETFEFLKGCFRSMITDIDQRIVFKKKG